MPDVKTRYANYPERELKVVIGDHINPTIAKSITRLSIGLYEMSFAQQEKGKQTCDVVKSVLHVMGKTGGYQIEIGSHKDFVGVFTARHADHTIQLWVTSPMELTQSGHIIWVRVTDTAGENKIGVAYKLATGFAAKDVESVMASAFKAQVVLEEGAPFILKGNPPPRFQKKAVVAAPVAAEPVAAEAPAAE